MLWIALHLPSLSLESFAATCVVAHRAAIAGANGGDDEESVAEPPIALIDEHRISAVNAAALAHGVKPGLKRATALALSPRIVLGQADPARDAEALKPVAHAALAFTPNVSLDKPGEVRNAPHTVLLEVKASLRYFGGLERLLQRLRFALDPLGHAVRIAVATTAAGAALLARVDPPPQCLTPASTCEAIIAAPVWLLGPGQAHWDALQGMGLRVIGDLLGLPRAGLARRFGESMLAEIDAALGRRPDPREPIVVARLFESRLELFARADSSEQVLYGASVLLARLVAWLSAQHAYVRRFRLLMHHETRWLHDSDGQLDRTPQATALEIALAEPSRDSAHLVVLLRERLGRVHLPAPTLELALQADDIVRKAAPSGELFATRQHEKEGLLRLIERLQARLGAARVLRLSAMADHRPERASRRLHADALFARPAANPRSAFRHAVARAIGASGKTSSDAKATAAPAPDKASTASPEASTASSGASKTSPASTTFMASMKQFMNARNASTASSIATPPSSGNASRMPTAAPTSLDSGPRMSSPSASVGSALLPPTGAASPGLPMRPVWLCLESEPLAEQRSCPLLDGQPLVLLSGPERIEAGWWDDDGRAERDYFIAEAGDGALVWIYRTRLSLSIDSQHAGGWYLQGRFG